MGKAGTSGTLSRCLTLVFDARKLRRGKVGREETDKQRDREIQTHRHTETVPLVTGKFDRENVIVSYTGNPLQYLLLPYTDNTSLSYKTTSPRLGNEGSRKGGICHSGIHLSDYALLVLSNTYARKLNNY